MLVKESSPLTDILQIDHIIPRSKGGGSNLLNLQLLYQECHEKKTAKKRIKEIDSQAELAEQPCKGKPLSIVSEEKPRGNPGAHSLRMA